jgi:hypothetical protein
MLAAQPSVLISVLRLFFLAAPLAGLPLIRVVASMGGSVLVGALVLGALIGGVLD